MIKVFIDGKEGTTGLRIYERLEKRKDIELLLLSDEFRKDTHKRSEMINASDITFLCLPDSAALEAISLCTNPNTVIIDASTANRTNKDFAYGLPELGESFYNNIKTMKRIANPGCYATGFITLVYPLIKLGILDKDALLVADAISGYSGAGKKGIKDYEDSTRSYEFDAPRCYGYNQMHKHLPEMKYITGLTNEPIFHPYVCDYYEGMLVNVSIFKKYLLKEITPLEICDVYKDFYRDSKIIEVMPFNTKGTESGFISGCLMKNNDGLKIYVSGNEERMTVTSVFDNLGKGASGAAVESMNIVLGLDPSLSLEL